MPRISDAHLDRLRKESEPHRRVAGMRLVFTHEPDGSSMDNEHNCVIEEQGFVSPQLQPVDRGTNAHRAKQVPFIAYNETVEWFEASGARGRTGRGVASTHSNWYQSAESLRMGPSHQGNGSMPAIGYRHEYSISIDLHCLGQGNIPHSMH
jgi:hypothetical protein